jgi:hypothetical protein
MVDETRSALIVASDDYTDPGLRRLRAPAADAQALAAVLRDPGIGGFEVRTLLNEPAHEVNLAVEEFFADRRPDDLLLVHFSCHGVKDESGDLYFAASNTLLRRLGATAVAAEFVNRRMSRSRSRRVVLLLDCCYAGAFERGMTARVGAGIGIEEQFGGRGRAVITASSSMEYAFEGDELADTRELAPSVFTSALVEGLETGDADRDQDGLVALDELYDYVYDKVRAVTPNQTPGKWTFGVQGELYIARRSRPVTTPAPLPPDLQQAIDHPLAGIRAGAVQELARLLPARHAGLALAAQVALERLTEDDSRTVSAVAAAVLSAGVPPAEVAEPAAAKLALSATIIDFGRLPLHGQSPERRVRLGNAGGGTLNARAATRANWLALRQAGDELVVAVDTSAAGEHEGVVSVDSDGGSATIRVLARVEPAPLPGPEPTATAHPDAAPEAPERARARPQQDAALPGASPGPVDAAPPAATTAPAPATPAGGTVAGPVVGAALPPIGVGHDAAPQARDDRRVLAAGGLAIAGAMLGVAGLFPHYQDSYSLVADSWTMWYVVIVAALTLTAGACMLIPRTRRLIGPGLLLGAVAASTSGLAFIVSDGVSHGPPPTPFQHSGFWLEFAANLVLVLAACLAGLTLARDAEVRLVRGPPQSALAWLVALLGVAGALALVFQDQSLWGTARSVPPTVASISLTFMALVVPACAAVAVPRRFGVALLTGWIGSGAAFFVYYYLAVDAARGQGFYISGFYIRISRGLYISSSPIIAFGFTLLALLVVAVPFARTAPAPEVERAAQG